jgi:hypothetical protein
MEVVMRAKLLTIVPALIFAAAIPAAAQVRVHVDIPIGHPRVLYGPHRQLLIREYDPALFGPWESDYDDWSPETVYLYNNEYYDYPIVSYATPVVVYRYRNQIFFPPREASFRVWRNSRFPASRVYDRGYVRPSPRVYERSRPEAYRSRPEMRGGRDVRPAPQNHARPESHGQGGGNGHADNGRGNGGRASGGHGNGRGHGH